MLDVRALRPRPRLSLTFVTLLPLVVALLLGGCGGGDSGSGRKLSRGTSASLQGTLDRVEQDFHSGDCTAAAQDAANLRQRAEALSQGSRRLRRALAASSARLETLVADQCQPATTTPAVEPNGTTGTTGEQGATGQHDAKGKKPKKEKPKPPKKPKETSPGPGEGGAPGQQGNGGGAGLPGESNPNGGN